MCGFACPCKLVQLKSHPFDELRTTNYELYSIRSPAHHRSMVSVLSLPVISASKLKKPALRSELIVQLTGTL